PAAALRPSSARLRRPAALVLSAAFGATFALAPATAHAQLPLSPMAPTGQTVTPAFEGWYKNHDGTFSISFGYLNRNSVEELDIPVGENNFIAPGAQNQGQPTHFATRRHWGVFAVVVPADFGPTKKVVWNLKFRGQSYAIPGSLSEQWQIDAIEGEASADDTPPSISFTEGGPAGVGPLGITSSIMTTAVGKPLAIKVFVKDDGKAEPIARSAAPVALAWFKHQGPGDVTFSTKIATLTATGGTSSTNASFSAPGEYLLRVRANDSPVASAGHAQCCWSNAFVRVTVTP
ncbi:MAG: hypothetical protein M3Y64_08970, partial [Gemmatimonadota bacterium]|nr:hypothetical protein [Gemmatimonadota bacterium]